MPIRPREALLSSRMVRLFLALAQAHGLDANAFAARHEVPADWPSREEIRLPLAELRKLADEIATALSDDELGVTSALAAPRGSYGIYEFISRNCSTFGDAVQAVVDYSEAFNGVVRYALERVRNEALWVFHTPGDSDCMGRHGNELASCIFLKTARQVVDSPLMPRRAFFSHAAPASNRKLTEVVGVAPTFGEPRNGLAFDLEFAEPSDPLGRSRAEVGARASRAGGAGHRIETV